VVDGHAPPSTAVSWNLIKSNLVGGFSNNEHGSMPLDYDDVRFPLLFVSICLKLATFIRCCLKLLFNSCFAHASLANYHFHSTVVACSSTAALSR
jgi:hypothetical protein